MKRDAQGRMLEFGAFPVLETPRLRLREITLTDVPRWLEIFSDPDIVELTAYPPPAGLEGARAELTEYVIKPFQESTGLRWGIVRKGETQLAGTLGFYRWVKERGWHAEMGYELLPAYRRQGIMTEAMTAVIDYGFGTMGLNRVQALTDPRNVPSQRLLRKLGFTHEGTMRENSHLDGRFTDDMIFGLLRREWEARREK